MKTGNPDTQTMHGCVRRWGKALGSGPSWLAMVLIFCCWQFQSWAAAVAAEVAAAVAVAVVVAAVAVAVVAAAVALAVVAVAAAAAAILLTCCRFCPCAVDFCQIVGDWNDALWLMHVDHNHHLTLQRLLVCLCEVLPALLCQP